MRSVYRATALLAAASFLATSLSAAPRQPTSPWRVEYAAAQCVAMRDYGTKAKRLFFALKPSPNGGVMRVLVIRKGPAPVDQSRAILRLGEKQLDTNLLLYPDDKNNYRIVSINVPMDEFKANLDIASIAIDGDGLNETLALTSVRQLVAELDNCLADLQQYWSIGDKYGARIARPAQPVQPLGRLFSSDDYPGLALNRSQEGRVMLTFLIDEKGQIADCSVESTSGVPALDTMSCYVIRSKARFTPAIGPDGKPVRSAHSSQINWRIAPRP